MPELPPNIHIERRLDENSGARHLHDLVKKVEADLRTYFKEQFDSLEELVNAKLDHHVSYKALFLAMLGTVVAVFIGAWTFLGKMDDKLSAKGASIDAQFEKLHAADQSFEARFGTKVEGMWSFFLEKQRADIVRAQVEARQRELAPPPTPINPLAPKARR